MNYLPALNKKEVLARLNEVLRKSQLETIYPITVLESRIKQIQDISYYNHLAQELLEAGNFKNLDDANEFLQALNDLVNITEVDELGGLSPNQIVTWERNLLTIKPSHPHVNVNFM
jgi:hypothetical protein